MIRENRGVSSIVGVSLMVGLVIILALGTGIFVFDITDRFSETPPEVELNVEEREFVNEEGDSQVYLIVQHWGGEPLESGGEIVIQGDVDEDDITYGNVNGDSKISSEGVIQEEMTFSDFVLHIDREDLSEGDEIIVVWEEQTGDNSETLISHTVS